VILGKFGVKNVILWSVDWLGFDFGFGLSVKMNVRLYLFWVWAWVKRVVDWASLG
jgi:hypothetical protein